MCWKCLKLSVNDDDWRAANISLTKLAFHCTSQITEYLVLMWFCLFMMSQPTCRLYSLHKTDFLIQKWNYLISGATMKQQFPFSILQFTMLWNLAPHSNLNHHAWKELTSVFQMYSVLSCNLLEQKQQLFFLKFSELNKKIKWRGVLNFVMQFISQT